MGGARDLSSISEELLVTDDCWEKGPDRLPMLHSSGTKWAQCVFLKKKRSILNGKGHGGLEEKEWGWI